MPLQVVFSETGKGNVSKNNKPSNDVAENMSKVVAKSPKPRTKNVDSINLNQTLYFIHACDKPPSEDNIEDILGKKSI